MKTIPTIRSIEPLESRIAPAQLINLTTLTYTDVDGDLVTVKISKGTFTDPAGGNVDDFTFAVSGLGEQLQLIDLSNDGITFDRANLTITAKRNALLGGDGFANIGHIEAGGIDLGSVTVRGDVGQIDAGDADSATTGLKNLTVQSLGRFGLSTQVAGGSRTSNITGPLGALVVKSDIDGATLSVSGGGTDANGRIGRVTVAGSLIGGASAGAIVTTGDMGLVKFGGDLIGNGGAFGGTGNISSGGRLATVTIGGSVFGDAFNFSGVVSSDGDMGPVKIGGSVRGGTGADSGLIGSLTGKIAGLTLGGSLVGGSDVRSGFIGASALGPVKIAGDVRGGSDDSTGSIVAGSLASLTLGGSLIGGSNDTGADLRTTGTVDISGAIGPVKIRGDILGGGVSGAGNLRDSATIQGGRIASLFVGGSIVAGSDNGAGALTDSGSIRAEDDLGPVTVSGSVLGNSANPVLITAGGQAVPTATADIAIKSVRIGHSAIFTALLAGFDTSRTPSGFNGDAQIGAVAIGGDWIASRLAAGTAEGANVFAGTDDDTFLAGGSAAILSRIASISIKGHALGTPSAGDSFRFMAQKIGSLKIGGTTFPMTAGADSLAVGATADLSAVDAF